MAKFVWRVSRGGYEWESAWDAADRPCRRLTTFHTGEGYWEYEPMVDTPDLYLRFAGLGLSDEEFLGFAAQYGALTTGVGVSGESPPEKLADADPPFGVRAGSPHGGAVAVGMPAASQTELHKALSEPNRRERRPIFDTAAEEPDSESAQLWADHAAQMQAMLRVWRTVRTKNEAAEEGVKADLESILSRRVGLAFDDHAKWPVCWPSDLLTALWLQFARAVAGEKTYRPCPVCGELYAVSGLGAGPDPRLVRPDKVYCGPECRQREAYKKKKAKRATAQRAAACRPEPPAESEYVTESAANPSDPISRRPSNEP